MEPSWDLSHLYSKTAIKVGTVLLVLVVLYSGAKAPTCIPVLIYKCKRSQEGCGPTRLSHIFKLLNCWSSLDQFKFESTMVYTRVLNLVPVYTRISNLTLITFLCVGWCHSIDTAIAVRWTNFCWTSLAYSTGICCTLVPSYSKWRSSIPGIINLAVNLVSVHVLNLALQWI